MPPLERGVYPWRGEVSYAAFPRTPPPLADQLASGGQLVQPIGPGGLDEVVLFMKENAELVANRSVTGARFVRLYGEHGYPLEQAPAEP